jgi:hypothetical protein
MWVDNDVLNMALKSDNVEFVWYCGGYFENGDRYKFFNVGNQFGTSLSTHISNCDDIGQCSPFSKWPPQYRKNSTLSDIITI